MEFIITFSILSLLFLFVLVILIQRFSPNNIYSKFGIGYTGLILFASIVVYSKGLWEPSMGLGLLFFMVAIFVGSLLNTLLVGGIVFGKKMDKDLLFLSLTMILLSPVVAYLSYSAISWYQIDRHITTACFSSGSQNYSLTLDSRDSVAYISEDLGPGASASYFDGTFRYNGDSVIIEGERVISYQNVEKRTYTLIEEQIIGFPDQQDIVQVKPCN